MLCTFAEEKLAVVVNLAYSVLSEHSCPTTVASCYSCIDVSKQNKLAVLWSCLYDVV